MLTPFTGRIPEFTYLDLTQADGATTGGWIWLSADQCNGCSFHNEWTGTYAATLTVEASNDSRCFEGHPDAANAAFDDITASVTLTSPVTGGGDDMITISNTRFAYIRLKLASVVGTGAFVSRCAGMSG